MWRNPNIPFVAYEHDGGGVYEVVKKDIKILISYHHFPFEFRRDYVLGNF